MKFIISPICTAYNRAGLLLFGLLASPLVALADSKVWNLGSGTGLDNVNKKLSAAGTIIMNGFRIVMLCLLIWRIIAFVREKKAMDLIFVVIAAVLLGFAEEIVVAFMSFGGS